METLCTYLHDFAILAPVECVELISFIVVRWNGSIRGGSMCFVFPPDLSAAQRFGQRWLPKQ